VLLSHAEADAELVPVDVPIVIESVLGDPSTIGLERVAAEVDAAEEARLPNMRRAISLRPKLHGPSGGPRRPA
jgi:hypothetical protein